MKIKLVWLTHKTCSRNVDILQTLRRESLNLLYLYFNFKKSFPKLFIRVKEGEELKKSWRDGGRVEEGGREGGGLGKEKRGIELKSEGGEGKWGWSWRERKEGWGKRGRRGKRGEVGARTLTPRVQTIIRWFCCRSRRRRWLPKKSMSRLSYK